MIQFNLLPDIKLEYIRAARLKRLVITISALVIATVILVVGLMSLSVLVLQKSKLAKLNTEITELTEELTKTPDLNRVLTIQNQIAKLPGLHQQKPQTSRLFDFVKALTPSDITISKVNVSFTDKTIQIDGKTDNTVDPSKSVNQFVDTLKFTKYNVTDKDPETGKDRVAEEGLAFDQVVLSSIGRSPEGTTYVITLVYSEVIFDNNKAVTLVVPDQITTRSETQKPLFEQAPKIEEAP